MIRYTVRRFDANPIIHPDMDASIGMNINGPSLIRAPSWLPNPMGRYYLYFAHHQGAYIRLAYADTLEGPWRIYTPGTLRLDQTFCERHIASPDVHVDEERLEVRMYFHGCTKAGQRSFLAVSHDGLVFTPSPVVLGPFYFRVFRHEDAYYAIAKTVEQAGGGVLLRSPDGRAPFDQGTDILPRMRHAALLRCGDMLRIFFSRGEDCPERILACDMPLKGDWTRWTPGEVWDVLSPEMDYEGADEPLEPSRFGAIHKPARQLRDPAIFEEDGRTYLIYSCAGERGLAMAELTE